MGLIRFLLALSVVAVHTGTSNIFGLKFIGGTLAVQSFYIISGFYMALVLNEKYIGKNNSFFLFMSNRFLRLYPAYIIVLILMVSKSFILLFLDHNYSSLKPFFDNYHKMHISSFAFLIFTNFTIFFQDWVCFLQLHNGFLQFTPNFLSTNPILVDFLQIPQAWTLGVELTFYIVAFFLLRKRFIWILSVLILSLGLRIFLYSHGFNYDPWNFRFFPLELALFLLGSISYFLYKIVRSHGFKVKGMPVILLLISIFIAIYMDIPGGNIKVIAWIIFLMFSIPFIFSSTKSSSFDNYLGELSYPVYISHMFIAGLVRKILLDLKLSNEAYSFWVGICCAVATVAFSMLLIFLIEKPMEAYRQRRLKS
jgi:peptidoglycan/LPS O-acetylase OafA/YrhL